MSGRGGLWISGYGYGVFGIWWDVVVGEVRRLIAVNWRGETKWLPSEDCTIWRTWIEIEMWMGGCVASYAIEQWVSRVRWR